MTDDWDSIREEHKDLEKKNEETKFLQQFAILHQKKKNEFVIYVISSIITSNINQLS